MNQFFLKIISASSCISLLTGCLATTNLIGKNSPLSKNDLEIANQMANTSITNCVTYTRNSSTNEKISGDKRIRKTPEVKKFQKSSDGWYSAHMMVDSVWDDVYYNSKTGQFICGSKNWQNLTDSTRVRFVDAVQDTNKSQQSFNQQRISMPGVVGKNQLVTTPLVDSNPFAFNVIADGPDVSQSGCITPVALNFIPAMPTGKSFYLIANGNNVAKVEVKRGYLSGFSYRAIMSSSGEVSAKCEGCKTTPKFITVTKSCDERSDQNIGPGTARIRTNDFEFKTLISGSLPNGKIHMIGESVEIIITPTKYTSINPYVGITTDPPFLGEGCVVVTPNDSSFSRRSCGIN